MIPAIVRARNRPRSGNPSRGCTEPVPDDDDAADAHLGDAASRPAGRSARRSASARGPVAATLEQTLPLRLSRRSASRAPDPPRPRPADVIVRCRRGEAAPVISPQGPAPTPALAPQRTQNARGETPITLNADRRAQALRPDPSGVGPPAVPAGRAATKRSRPTAQSGAVGRPAMRLGATTAGAAAGARGARRAGRGIHNGVWARLLGELRRAGGGRPSRWELVRSRAVAQGQVPRYS